MGYFVAVQGVQQGPFELSDLPAKGLRADSLVWTEGMAEWQRADTVPELQSLLKLRPALNYSVGYPPGVPPMRPGNSNRIAAGVCEILLGALGVHKFILGFTGTGILMLLISLLTCGIGAGVMSIIGLIEGIIYLTKSDEEFYQLYVVQKKQWF